MRKACSFIWEKNEFLICLHLLVMALLNRTFLHKRFKSFSIFELGCYMYCVATLETEMPLFCGAASGDRDMRSPKSPWQQKKSLKLLFDQRAENCVNGKEKWLFATISKKKCLKYLKKINTKAL